MCVLKEPLQTLKDRFITLKGSSERSYLFFSTEFSQLLIKQMKKRAKT